MPAFNLNGIPISDEQCIGDSLPIINNAFLSLSSNLTISDGDLSRLTNRVGILSTTNLFVIAASAFELRPVHNRSIVVCNNPSQLNVTIATNAVTFEVGHQTVFVQTNAGKVVFNSGLSAFNCLNGNTAIAGRNGVVAARFAGTRGWFVDGDLKSATEPPALLSLVAQPGTGVEDIDNGIAFVGPIEDTLYYYASPGLSATPGGPMDVYVNGFYRTTVDFPEDMLGAYMGYSLAGYIGTTPQTTTKFKEGRLDLFLEGGNPVFRNLTASLPPGSEDPFASISITGSKKDTVFYYTSPAKSAIPTYMDIYVNGLYRTTIDFQEDRLGTQFGYKVEEHFGNAAQVTGTFVDEQSVYFTIPGALIPTAIELIAATGVGNESEELNMRIAALQSAYAGDVIATFPWPGQSAEPRTATIRVDGVDRAIIDYTADREGDKFWYRLAGSSGAYQAEALFPVGDNQTINLTINGQPALPTPTPSPTTRPTATPRATPLPTPTPTSTPQTTQTLFYLTSKPVAQGGSDDDLNAISIRSITVTNEYNDTISYRALSLPSIIMAEPMDIYINGVHRTTVDFPEARLGTSFTYKRFGQNESLVGVFASSRVNLAAIGSETFTLVAKPAAQGGTDDPANAISITSTNALYNDTIRYQSLELTSYIMAEPMDIYINNIHRTTVDFPEGRTGTPFTYTPLNSSITINGVFTPGRRDLVLPVVTPVPTPLPTATPQPTQSLGSFAWSIAALTDNGEGNFTGSGTVGYPLNLTPSNAGQPDNGLSITSAYQGDILYGNNLVASSGDPAPKLMIVYVSGVARSVVEFDSARAGTQFGYKIAGGSTVLTGNFIDGERYL